VYVTDNIRDGNVTTLAYSARPGARLWARIYVRHRNDDRAYSVAVSPSGTVIVTGSSRGSVGNADCATAAYNVRTGAQLMGQAVQRPG